MWRPWKLVLLLAAGLATPLAAAPTPGLILGYVHDQAGRPLAGVEVSARPEKARAAIATTTTDAAGAFRLGPVPAGRYVVTALSPRLRRTVATAVVGATPVELSLIMEVAAREESVSVVEKAPLISTTRPSLKESYDLDLVESLPMSSAESVSPAPSTRSTPSPPSATRARTPLITTPSPLPPGILTAGLWDDNLNFDHYRRYLSQYESGQPPGLVVIPREDRMAIDVVDAGRHLVSGAEVEVKGPRGRPYRTITPADGRVWYFPRWMGVQPQAPLEISVRFGDTTARATARPGQPYLQVALPGQVAASPIALDLLFLVDTTGSMGDEIRYLQTELDN
ncbi:MAG TPA: carboxypeptidase regulatory-like domain-containing protein, partial [Polyangia bacterium]|nr:carboxypeptidase regulatory-like domain-containing protein [Polyangia bacterium]